VEQEVINKTNSNSFNATFQQKSDALSLVITASAALYFTARIWPMQSAAQSESLPDGYGGLLLTTLALIVVAQVVLQIVLVFGASSAESPTAAERTAALRARRNAYFVLAAGMIAAVGSIFLGAPAPFWTASIAILALVLAEITKFASQLYYTRQ
jgi:hypothetical protein